MIQLSSAPMFSVHVAPRSADLGNYQSWAFATGSAQPRYVAGRGTANFMGAEKIWHTPSCRNKTQFGKLGNVKMLFKCHYNTE